MSRLLSETIKALRLKPQGGWMLSAEAEDQLANCLRRSMKRAPSIDTLQPLLKLIATLERDPRSRDTAERICALIKGTPKAVEVLIASRGRVGRRSFSAFEGKRRRAAAPRHDAPAPKGSLPGWQLMRPLRPAFAKR